MSKHRPKIKLHKDVVDAEIVEMPRPKASAVAVNAALGGRTPNKRFETPQQTWEDLEVLYQGCASGVYETGASINLAMSTPGLKGFFKDPNEVNVAINGLTKDLTMFAEDLVKIHARHEGRTGNINGGNDMALSLSVFEDYVDFNTKFKALTLPTVLTIMDHIGEAANAMMEKVKELEAAEAAPASTETAQPGNDTQVN